MNEYILLNIIDAGDCGERRSTERRSNEREIFKANEEKNNEDLISVLFIRFVWGEKR